MKHEHGKPFSTLAFNYISRPYTEVILKIAELILYVVKAVLTLAQNVIIAAIKAIGSFGNMGRQGLILSDYSFVELPSAT